MSRGEELLNVPTTVHLSAQITRYVVHFRIEFQIMCVVPEFVAVIGRVAVKVTQPSAMTVFAKKYEHQADVYE